MINGNDGCLTSKAKFSRIWYKYPCGKEAPVRSEAMHIPTILSGFLLLFGLLLDFAVCQPSRPGSSSFLGSSGLRFEDADWIKDDFSGTESYASSFCTDSADNVYLAGPAKGYGSSPPDVWPNNWREAEYDAYLFKLDSRGRTLWNIWWDHGDLGSIQGMACDSNDDIYLSGSYESGSAFKPSAGHHKQWVRARYPKVGFLLKYDSAGNLLWTRTWSTGGYDMETAFLCISGSDIYIAGDFSGTLTFDDTAGTSIAASSKSAMIAKVTPAGDIEWVRIIANDPDRKLSEIEILPDGTWYVVYKVPDRLPNKQNMTNTDSPLVVRLDATFSETWTREFSYHWGQFVFDKDANIYFAGSASTNMEITANNPFPQGPADLSGADRVLYKFDSSGQLLWTVDADRYIFTSPAIDDAGNVYACGEFSYSADFDPGPGQAIRNSAGKTSIMGPSSPFICKYDSSGNFQWVRSGSFEGYTHKIIIGASGFLFMSGSLGQAGSETARIFLLRMPS
jgi:hypothetical protein